MATVILLAVGCLLLAMFAGGNEKPSELDPKIWRADPEECRARLEAATAAWRAGRRWVPPEELEPHARQGWAGRQALADPNREEPSRRLVRRHPMRPPHWE